MIGRFPSRLAQRSPTLDEPQPTAPRAAPDSTAPDASDGPPPSDPPPTDAPPTPGSARSHQQAPGLREQVGDTRESAKRLFDAHLELARAEFEEIGGAIKLAVALGGLAVGALLVAGLLVTVGTPLILGEWIFGSLGWGLLHGLLFMVAIAATAGLAAVGTSGSSIARAFGVAVLLAIVVGIVLGLDLTNRAWGTVGDSIVPLVAPESRPLVAALLVLPVVGGILLGLLGLLRAFDVDGGRRDRPTIAARFGAGLPAAAFVGWLVGFAYAYTTGIAMPDIRLIGAGLGGLIVAEVVLIVIAQAGPGSGLPTGLSIGTVLGLVLAFMTALAFGGRVGAAIGVTAGLIAWPALLGADFAARGIDAEALKERFIPRRTIDTAKETMEWARERMPLSRRS
jgi:hypothetical protein